MTSTSTSPHPAPPRASRVAVLGLGRMGAAIAQRLADQGWEVSGWTRSGLGPPGLPTQQEPEAAVDGAGLVVLALFDGPACADVVARVRRGIAGAVTVVNTSTVDPEEAVALEGSLRTAGAGYVHAPVLGSVGAARSGGLRVLAGGAAYDVERARPLLDCLGEVLTAGGVADAAALKLMANGALGSALEGIRAGRLHAAELGLEPGLALDVLERGPLGRLVQGMRERVDGGRATARADFAVEALAKDLTLLAARSPAARPLADRVRGALAAGAVAGDDDIAVLTAPCERPTIDGLELSDGLDVTGTATDEVLAPLRAYVRGHATGDPSHFREAFLPSAHVEGVRDGTFVSWPLEEYCALFPGHPTPDEADRRRRLDAVTVTGTVGTAAMTLEHGPDTFTDVFLLVRVDGRWWIANKAYHRR